MQFVLPLADTLEAIIVTEIIARFNVKVKVISGHAYDVISCTDLALVASGRRHSKQLFGNAHDNSL